MKIKLRRTCSPAHSLFIALLSLDYLFINTLRARQAILLHFVSTKLFKRFDFNAPKWCRSRFISSSVGAERTSSLCHRGSVVQNGENDEKTLCERDRRV